jgi:hypothetical protein
MRLIQPGSLVKPGGIKPVLVDRDTRNGRPLDKASIEHTFDTSTSDGSGPLEVRSIDRLPAAAGPAPAARPVYDDDLDEAD